MGVGPLIGFLILIVLAAVITITFFPKRTGKRLRLRRSIGGILIVLILSPIFILAFEENFYFEKDAISDLEKLDIKLHHDFEIINNEIVGLTDYYQTTTIRISTEDKESIKNDIASATNLKRITLEDFYASGVKYSDLKNVIYNYHFKDSLTNKLIREKFEKQEGYAATTYSASINIDNNNLTIRVVSD